MAQYPTADPSFSTLTDGVDYPQADDINSVYREVEAIGSALRGTLDHDVELASGKNLTVGGTLEVAGAITATAGQVVFPATQNASSDKHTLDDYEEDTWTLTVTPASGSITLSSATGQYTKIGRMVVLTGYFIVGSVSTPSGAVTLGGFPFAAAANAAATVVCNQFAAGLTQPACIIDSGGTTGRFFNFSAGNLGNAGALFQANADFRFMAVYFAS